MMDFMRNCLNKKEKNIFNKITSAILFLMIWELVAMKYIPIIFPSPIEVLKGFVELCQKEEFYRDIILTVSRGIAGYVLSMVLGLIIATLFYMVKSIKNILYSYIVILQSIPRISWMLLAMIWFPFNSTIIIFILIVPNRWRDG